MYPIEQCSSIIDHHPNTCGCCGEALSGEDKNPYRHQIVELPPITPIVVEHRLHQLVCSQCGNTTRAVWPIDVNPSGYGERVVATVARKSGLYRHSHRMVKTAMEDLFGIPMSKPTVNRLRMEASMALKDPVDSAKKYVQHQPVVAADETS
ncbi:MAG: IS66 family transposase [Moorea sp. SIO2I5]|nr:IS66 family transposase [Moorena sp. SIO2I5]